MDNKLRILARTNPEAYMRALCRIRNPLIDPMPGDVVRYLFEDDVILLRKVSGRDGEKVLYTFSFNHPFEGHSGDFPGDTTIGLWRIMSSRDYIKCSVIKHADDERS